MKRILKELENFFHTKNTDIHVVESSKTDDGFFIATKINSIQLGRIRIPENSPPDWMKNDYDDNSSLVTDFENKTGFSPNNVIEEIRRIEKN